MLGILIAAVAGLVFGRFTARALDARRGPAGGMAQHVALGLPALYALALAGFAASGRPVLGLAALTLVEAARADLAVGRIPNELTALSAVGAVGLRLSLSLPLAGPVVAAVVAVVALLGVRALGSAVARRPGMGLGDVKLAGALGLLLGWDVLWVLYLAAAVVAVLAVGERALVWRGRPRRVEVPFAPFIAGGAVLAYLFPFPW